MFIKKSFGMVPALGRTVWIVLAALYGVVYLVYAAKTGHPLKTIFSLTAAGLAALFLVNITARWSNVFIPVNGYSLGVAAALGMPGTVGLLLLQTLFSTL